MRSILQNCKTDNRHNRGLRAQIMDSQTITDGNCACLKKVQHPPHAELLSTRFVICSLGRNGLRCRADIHGTTHPPCP